MPKYVLVDDAIKTTWMILDGLGYSKQDNEELMNTVHSVFMTAPLVETTVRYGQWNGVYLSSPSSYVGTCSACGQRNDIPPPPLAKYCPNCGARMVIGRVR